MNRHLLSAFAGAVAMLLGVCISGATARPARTTPPPQRQAVEYRFFVPSSTAAFTSEHEKELDALGAQGWRVVAPIYAGGMLNSYLMMRVKR